MCRSIWADIDHVNVEHARQRWERACIPAPSILVNSGNGVHAYWLLDQPFFIATNDDRDRFEFMLKALYRRMGCDTTSDVSRLLRLPGFWNTKERRNGRAPLVCSLVQCRPDCWFSIDLFRHDASLRGDTRFADSILSTTNKTQQYNVDEAEVHEILCRLDHRVHDRSRRDYGVVCELIRIGIAPEKIWRLVAEKSKFRTNGRPYFDTTLKNALVKIRA
jgi:hypothetical protein